MKYIANLNAKEKIELSEEEFTNAKEIIITGLGRCHNKRVPHKLIAIGENGIDFFIVYPTDKFIKRED